MSSIWALLDDAQPAGEHHWHGDLGPALPVEHALHRDSGDVTVSEVAPHPPLKCTSALTEGGAAVSVHTQDRQAREVTHDGVDLGSEPDPVELRQVDAEPWALAVGSQYLRVDLRQERGLGQALGSYPLLGSAPDGGVDTCLLPHELRGGVDGRHGQLRRRVDLAQVILPVLQVPAIRIAGPQTDCGLHVVLEGVGGRLRVNGQGACLIQLLPLAEHLEHAPTVDEGVVEAEEEPCSAVPEGRVSHVEARPAAGIEPLTRHLPPHLGDPSVLRCLVVRDFDDRVVRRFWQEALSQTVIADNGAEHRVSADESVEGVLQPLQIEHGHVHLDVAVARYVPQLNGSRAPDEVGLLHIGQGEGLVLVLTVLHRWQLGLGRDLARTGLDSRRHISEYRSLEDDLQAELDLEALLDLPPEPGGHQRVTTESEVVAVGTGIRPQQGVPDLDQPGLGLRHRLCASALAVFRLLRRYQSRERFAVHLAVGRHRKVRYAHDPVGQHVVGQSPRQQRNGLFVVLLRQEGGSLRSSPGGDQEDQGVRQVGARDPGVARAFQRLGPFLRGEKHVSGMTASISIVGAEECRADVGQRG